MREGWFGVPVLVDECFWSGTGKLHSFVPAQWHHSGRWANEKSLPNALYLPTRGTRCGYRTSLHEYRLVVFFLLHEICIEASPH